MGPARQWLGPAQSAVDRSQQDSRAPGAHGSATEGVAPAGQVSGGAGASSGDQNNGGASPKLSGIALQGASGPAAWT